MSNAISGQQGKLILAGGEILEIRTWSISRPADALDATSMSSGGNREYKAGVKSWNGSFETVAYYNLHGSAVVGSFYTGTAAASTTPVYSGTIVVTDAGIGTSFDGLVAYAHTFQGSGPCTPSVS